MLNFIIVEHERSVINVLKLMLQQISERLKVPIHIPEDESLFVAKDYNRAKFLIEMNPPDFILLDLNLGNRDKTGYDLFVDCILPLYIPIIIVTGENRAGLAKPHFFPNIPFLEKPIDEDELLEEIKEITRPNYAAIIKKRYSILSNAMTIPEDYSEQVELKDGDYTYVPVKNIIYIKSEFIHGRSKSYCHLKGIQNPVLCHEELNRFLAKIQRATLDFEKVGRNLIVNRAYTIKKSSQGYFLQMVNGDKVKISRGAFDGFITKSTTS